MTPEERAYKILEGWLFTPMTMEPEVIEYFAAQIREAEGEAFIRGINGANLLGVDGFNEGYEKGRREASLHCEWHVKEAVDETAREALKLRDHDVRIVKESVDRAVAEAYQEALRDYKADGLDIAYKQGLEDAAKIADQTCGCDDSEYEICGASCHSAARRIRTKAKEVGQ